MEKERVEERGEGKKEGTQGAGREGKGQDRTRGSGGGTVELGYHQRKIEAETLDSVAPGPTQQIRKSEFLAGVSPVRDEPRLRRTHHSADCPITLLLQGKMHMWLSWLMHTQLERPNQCRKATQGEGKKNLR